ncbi:YdcF family protein [Vibrio sp. SCSIO 43136]|uniref:YdcF family protein n=1 Tax=Vibrio sp. SCSIO 43136 TaxID=2819101 RepID=UPI002074CDC9|nr:YdcF family protein [Vibrio sp. SCSIO 43136]USD66778.1 YdcF family protein [Vibrio sp. SCSIO 43136]
MSECKVEQLVVVLGKRLQHDNLTPEGKSRIDALMSYLTLRDCSNIAVAFCGGITPLQSVSEAYKLHQYFVELGGEQLNLEAVLLESESLSTVQNFQNLAQKLIESNLVSQGEPLKLTLVSNDYHLERIFEIQQLLDAQGLLRVLESRCTNAGVNIHLSRSLDEHIVALYPHKGVDAQLFLAVESLTTYRVYLEGVIANVFTEKLSEIRCEPLRLARNALTQIEDLAPGTSHRDYLQPMLVLLSRCIESTTPDKSYEEITHWLAILDTNLTMLNRMLDPETSMRSWWKG